ncbi:MAG: efflux RND transporter periplasmic adaptor subunit [Halarcobacter sp.]
MKIVFNFIIALCLYSSSLLALEVTGIVLPKHHLELTLPIDGKILNIFLKEGNSVKKNQEILTLDDSLQMLDTKRKKMIYRDSSQYNSLKKNERLLKEMLDSTKEIYKRSKSVSKDELMSLEIRYHDLLGQMLATKQKKLIERIDYEMSKNILESHKLTSPIDGVITKIRFDIGEWVKSGESIVEVVNYKECFVEFNIEQKYAQELTLGKSLAIKIKNGEKLIDKNSKIVFISPIADKSSSLVRIKAKLENKDLSIVPGLSAFIYFDKKGKEINNSEISYTLESLEPLDDTNSIEKK